jgi:hypothetical protein
MIRSLVNDIVVSANKLFGDQCRAVYLMGSLARGGFSEIASDIDIGVILKEPLLGAGVKIDEIKAMSLAKHPSVNNTVSIFWGSVASINGTADVGRYPPFDRLDLIDHALLLSGQDIRKELVKPSKRLLEVTSAEFSLDYLGSKERIDEFRHCHRIAQKGAVYVTKTILFPARFIYLADTGGVAGNEVSCNHYIANYQGPDADLVQKGYSWRFAPLPVDLGIVTSALEQGLVPLYSRFIDIYTEVLGQYGEDKLESQLLQWKLTIRG